MGYNSSHGPIEGDAAAAVAADEITFGQRVLCAGDIHSIARVAERRQACGVHADEVADDGIAHRAAVVQVDAVLPVAADQIAFAGHRTADDVVLRAAVHHNPAAGVAEHGRAVQVGADAIADQLVVRRAAARDVDAVLAVATHQVAPVGGANLVAGRAVIHRDARPRIGYRRIAVEIGPDPVVKHEVMVRVIQADAIVPVAADQVGLGWLPAADCIIVSKSNRHAIVAVPQRRGARGVSADSVAHYNIVMTIRSFNANPFQLIARNKVARDDVVRSAGDQDAGQLIAKGHCARKVDANLVADQCVA